MDTQSKLLKTYSTNENYFVFLKIMNNKNCLLTGFPIFHITLTDKIVNPQTDKPGSNKNAAHEHVCELCWTEILGKSILQR